jgi:general secretion pathway protein J
MRRARGFTLVELLAALFALALLAALSWRGLDGMMRAQQATEARADEVLALQTGLAQWSVDLEAVIELPLQTPLEWNGRVLRLTRHNAVDPAGGALVVGWTRREGQWLRWQSAPLLTRADVDAAWRLADQWSQTPVDSLRAQQVSIAPLDDWQIFFYRCDSWTNPQSSAAGQQSCGPGTGAGTPPAAATGSVLPDGVRVVLQLPAGRAISGTLVRDWARP